MKKFETDCDMSSIKIFNDSMSCFFDNGIGDCTTIVYIEDGKGGEEPEHDLSQAKFLGHFTVKTKAFLADYDCSDDNPLYTFSKGRWFVSRVEDAVMLIEKVDEDVHA